MKAWATALSRAVFCALVVVAVLCLVALPAFGMAAKAPAQPADLSAALAKAQNDLAASQKQAKAATDESATNAAALAAAQTKADDLQTALTKAENTPHPDHLLLGFILGGVAFIVAMLILLYSHSAQIEKYETRLANLEDAVGAKVEALIQKVAGA